MLTQLLKRTGHFVIPMILFIGFSSCKKSSDKSSPTTVEYKITPMNQYFTSIQYNDNTGSSITLSDPSQFINGVKDISISSKPFDAKLETQINNTTAQTINYTLAVLVNGQVAKITQASAAPMQTSSSSVEYTIQ
jgi:hypothetical protein